MSKPETALLTAAVAAFLALASLGANGKEPSVLAMLHTPTNNAIPERLAVSGKMAATNLARKKPKLGKAKLHNGLNNFRTPARQALDRIGDAARGPLPADGTCAAIAWNGRTCGQSRAYAATLQQPALRAAEDIDAGVPNEGEPGFVRAQGDLPGLVPGRESIYKLSFNLPLGKNEAVNLQARVRKNAFNAQDGNDSTLRADWSLRF